MGEPGEVPIGVATFAAGAFWVDGETDPDKAWAHVADMLRRRLGIDYPAAMIQEAACAWAAENLNPHLLMSRRWF